jgi:hypothetical protein
MSYMEDPMRLLSSNRRKNRSDDIHLALNYQLAASAERARFGAMVLADHNGLVMAEAGNRDVCEEMAALSPVLAPNERPWHGDIDIQNGRVRLTVAPLYIDNLQLYLTASGGSQAHEIAREMATSGQGVVRILN